MTVSYVRLVNDNMKRPNGPTPPPDQTRTGTYEPEHSESQVSGSVAVGREARWYATLAVALTGDQSILVTIERQGPTTPDTPEVDEIALVIPPGEVDAVVALLQGLVAHARRDRVLGA